MMYMLMCDKLHRLGRSSLVAVCAKVGQGGWTYHEEGEHPSER